MNAHDRNFSPVPEALDSERGLLGALMTSSEAYWRVSGFLKPDHFQEPINAEVYRTIGVMLEEKRAITPMTVRQYLPAGQGEATSARYLAGIIADAMPPVAAYDLGCSIVEAWMRRMGIARLEDGISMLRDMTADTSPGKIFAEVMSSLDGLAQVDESKEGAVAQAVDGIMERMTASERKPTVPFPLDQLREIMGGDMEAGNLYGMLSSSGEGKTSLALQIMGHAATQGHPVAFLSYDQSEEQCVDQIASQRTGIENTRIRNRTLTEREMSTYLDALADIKKLPLFIRKCSSSVDGSAQLAAYIRSLHGKRFRRLDKPALVVLDHSRKVKPRNENAHEGRIAAEANGVFKQIASDLGLVWFNLMQRSSFGTKRKNPRPIDADIYGGESGKEDYDGVFYLYRGHKYLKAQLATADDAKDEDKIRARFAREKWEEDEAEVGALKARFADPSRWYRLRFEKEFTRYVSKRSADEAERNEPGLF
ncbi:DnaB-like helicase C-terminal domain-containing protein [Mesorhizobium sp. B2-1-3A]|uniref:replicative DNA helicase n=1 Tax=Mesorhizobium sp. B2-1-3A TaxID=2589971 RepID=UPI00112B584A|nr:DnaB-like helicase C-terminal domain-containing protein [Mesorhizobium sp. B2-1-3A]TPM89842.1 hypothetical protein FJ977_35270 [Mesorhizobium sp. B2-1-3A]